MAYKIEMNLNNDFLAVEFIHPGPGAEAIRFMEMLTDFYRAHHGHAYKFELTLTLFKEEQDARD